MSYSEYYALLLFSLEAILRCVAKNNSTKKQIAEEIQTTLKHVPA